MRQISKRLDHLWPHLIGAVRVGVLLLPSLVYAHGDDDLTAATFIGPILAFVVVVTLVGLGKVFLRAILKRS